MANSWFRLYAEFANDPKVQMMNEAYQRRLIMLMCCRCSNGAETLHDSELCFLLRISAEEWSETKQHFISKGFISADNDLLNWEKRQFASDSSTERVAKHRAKIKESENAETECNVSVTPQNRTEQNRINTSAFAEFYAAYPKKKNRGDAERAFKKLNPDTELLKKILSAIESAKRTSGWLKDDGQFIPYPATWLNARGWEDELTTKSTGKPWDGAK
jgi:hypothetical protein